MSHTPPATRSFTLVATRPWTLEGPVDLDFEDECASATCAQRPIRTCRRRFRRKHPLRLGATYDEMVRALDCVWDCPDDGTVDVTASAARRAAAPRAEFIM